MRQMTCYVPPPHTPNCIYCGNAHVSLNGHRNGRQLYRCRYPSCLKQFTDKGSVFGHHFPPEVTGEAVGQFYHGMSLAQVVEKMSERAGDAPLSRETVRRWVIMHTREALRRMDGVKAATSGYWVAVDIVECRRDRSEVWAWFIFDAITMFALACHLSGGRNKEEAAVVLRMAGDAALRAPLAVQWRIPSPYAAAVREIFPETEDMNMPTIEGPGGELLPGVIEEALRVEVKRTLRMGNLDRGLLHLRGWLLSINFMEGYQVLPGKEPPCTGVGLRSYLTNWQSVAKPRPVHRSEPR